MLLKLINVHFSVSFFLTFSLLFSLSLSNNPDFTVLLAFKRSADASNSLPWSSSDEPCSWLGVTCHPSTHRVLKLVLNNLNLTGSTHTLTHLTHLRHLSLHHNRLSSALTLSSWPNLKHLYLSHNRFSGAFPDGVSRLRRILRFDISYNQFSGEIPMTQLAQLPHLLTLKLEFNAFTGTLNSSNSSSVSILEFNVAGNDLAGEIPNWLSNFPMSSFAGNFRLCGEPLPSRCYNQKMHSKPIAGGDSTQIGGSDGRKKKLRNGVEMMIVTVVVVAVLLTLVIVTWCCYSRRYKCKYRERKKAGGEKSNLHGGGREIGGELVCFEGCRGFAKVDELLKASAEMLGKGSVGTTYKVVMEGGDVVVVKRVRVRMRGEKERRKRKEVDGFLRKIGGLIHPNIASLRAFSSSKDELLLLYDFLPNGSLYALLHGNRGPGRMPLDWTTRLKLASGSAEGLAFLHSHNKAKLFHGHLTTSNIIVDHSGIACISDIGLHQLLHTPISPNNAYKAPEQLMSNESGNKYPQKSDIYSFGIILLEILTGKTATAEGEVSLEKWVRRLMVQEEWSWEVFDFELLSYKKMEGEMMALLEVALLCLAPLSTDRPKMSIVHKMIVDIEMNDTRGETRVSAPNDQLSDSSSLSESTLNFISS